MVLNEYLPDYWDDCLALCLDDLKKGQVASLLLYCGQWRPFFHLDCTDAILDSVGAECALGNLPYSSYYPSGVRIYDVDDCISVVDLSRIRTLI